MMYTLKFRIFRLDGKIVSGPITEFVTEITLHTNINKRRLDISFRFFPISLPN